MIEFFFELLLVLVCLPVVAFLVGKFWKFGTLKGQKLFEDTHGKKEA